MTLPENLKILSVDAWMDGGSITINCIAQETEENIVIEFCQNATLKIYPDGKIPGRIYINSHVVKVNSYLQNKIISFFKRSINNNDLEGDDVKIITEKINYIESEKYIIDSNETAEKQRLQLAYREFDWFAIDVNGNYALMSSADSDAIPLTVAEDYIMHDIISEFIEIPNYGSILIWEDFAKYGFYVYDWNGNFYQKKAKPFCPIPDNIRIMLENLDSVFAIDLVFEIINEIKI